MIKRYLISLIIFLGIDLFWLVLVAPKFYKSHIGHLMSDTVSLWPALLFYMIYIVALLVFVINPTMDSPHYVTFLKGALLGLAMYATYDLTNLATLKDWPVIVTVADLLWGSFVTGLTCLLSSLIFTKFNF